MGGLVYHVLNRAAGRAMLFEKDADYEAFERVLEEAWRREPTRIVAYCVMPNHWHMVLWPRRDDPFSGPQKLSDHGLGGVLRGHDAAPTGTVGGSPRRCCRRERAVSRLP